MARRTKRKRSEVGAKLNTRYSLVAMGGTFDVLHKGHRKLLRQAFTIGRNVMIGITSDEFARTLHKPHKLDSYAKRKRDVEHLLSRWGVLSRAKIVPLRDRYGPTVRESRIQAIVVSRRTLKTAYEINSKRRAKRLKPLIIDPIDLIMAEDKRPISSTRIRRGSIDREGRLVEE
jgi:pantetheine-phosphate adenylyltransferase